ncbi:hypothetical protein ACOMHN_046419 [Nucella lapillus]
MEPMDLDDDSPGRTPPPAFASREAHSLTSPVSHLTPPCSPRIIPGGMRNVFPAIGTSAANTPPFQFQSSSLASSWTWQTSSFVDSPRGRGATSPGEDSAVSMETSDLSDVSQMEDVHNSPSPISDPASMIRSAPSNFSLFKKETESDQGSITGFVTEEGVQGKEMKAENMKTPKPTLLTMQAPAALKQRNGRRQSGSKSPEFETQEPEPVSEIKGLKACITKKVSSSEEVMAKGNLASKKKSGCGRLCVGVLSVLVVAIVGCLSLHFHHNLEQRQTFASVNTQLLRQEITSKLYGQHIAAGMVLENMERYLATLLEKTRTEDEETCVIPPLVLSFHGCSGVGKTFLSNLIPHAFPAKNAVNLVIPYHLPPHLENLYESEARDSILSSIRDYSINFFLLDDMEKAKPGILQGIHSAITKLGKDNPCRSPVVIIFVSNTFEEGIDKRVFQAMMDGKDREDLSVSHFSSLFEAGGDDDSWYQVLRSDITATVPFLPLEKQHIIQCIYQDLVAKRLPTYSSLVDRALKELGFDRLPTGQEFSPSGCKRVSDKVTLTQWM